MLRFSGSCLRVVCLLGWGHRQHPVRSPIRWSSRGASGSCQTRWSIYTYTPRPTTPVKEPWQTTVSQGFCFPLFIFCYGLCYPHEFFFSKLFPCSRKVRLVPSLFFPVFNTFSNTNSIEELICVPWDEEPVESGPMHMSLSSGNLSHRSISGHG